MADRYHAVAEIARASAPSPEDLLKALATLPELRRDLDRFERALIEAARERGIGWAQISTALGLSSRQAAEQRLLRLAGDATRDPKRVRDSRDRQRTVDNRYGPQLSDLRAAVLQAGAKIAADPDWDSRHPRAALLRMSLDAAAQAAPGALYTLVNHALADLAAMPSDRLPGGISAALTHLRRAAQAAKPDEPMD